MPVPLLGRAIRCRHSAVDEERGGRVVARHIYVPPCCINNPNNKHNPRYMPLTIFNLSTVDHLYIGKDTVIAFAEQPVLET